MGRSILWTRIQAATRTGFIGHCQSKGRRKTKSKIRIAAKLGRELAVFRISRHRRLRISDFPVGPRTVDLLFASRRLVRAVLGFLIAVEEDSVVSDCLFDELFEEEELRAVDDGVDALLESLHWCEGLERITEQDHGGVAPLAHGHALERLKGEIFADVIGGEKLLDNDDLIADLAKADKEIAMGRGGMNFIAELGQGSFGGVEPFGG